MKKFLIFSSIGVVGFLIGRGFQIAIDWPVLSDYADLVCNSMNRKGC